MVSGLKGMRQMENSRKNAFPVNFTLWILNLTRLSVY